MMEDMEACPACGALPCDQADPAKARAMQEALAEVFADHGAVNRLSWTEKAGAALS